jgi:outer membrane protein assembly factor BamE
MIPKALLINRGSRVRRTLIVAAAVAVLAGCSTYDSLTQRFAQSITPYRITVVQGNFVSKEAAAQMQVGMSRAQVRQILGTPLLADMFHADRWDYVFYF